MPKMKSLRPKYHITPPTGWMNDSNGLCEYRNEYHIFFQSTPETVKNGLKKWGTLYN